MRITINSVAKVIEIVRVLLSKNIGAITWSADNV